MKMWFGPALLSAGLFSTVCAPTSSVSESSEVRVALVGQALSRYDPRDYLLEPAGTVVPYLRSADVAFTNLEVSIDGEYCPCTATKEGNSLQVGRPPVVEFLSRLNFGLMALSNNHSWNLSEDGIRSTIKAADNVGVTHAGTGENSAEAVAAGVREVGGIRIGLVASATVKLGPAAAATETKPGVNLVRLGDDRDWTRNLASIRSAADTTDVLLVYQHFQITEDDLGPEAGFGHRSVVNLDGWQRDWAHAVIDAGASLYVAHGSREFKGVEIYDGRPIFYGLGNFIFHSGQPVGHYAQDVWESVVATVTFLDNEPVRVDFVPIVLDEGVPGEDFLQRRGVPEVAEGERALTILERLAAFSAELGSEVRVDGERATLDVGPRK